MQIQKPHLFRLKGHHAFDMRIATGLLACSLPETALPRYRYTLGPYLGVMQQHVQLQGGAKNGASLSHCKYSENSMTELRGNW